jgi:hypothetical protein
VKHRNLVVVVLAVLAAIVLPELASACPMCIAGRGGDQRAFAIGSVFLSVTPPLAIGLMVLYVRRRARAIAAEEAARDAEPLPAAQAVAQH